MSVPAPPTLDHKFSKASCGRRGQIAGWHGRCSPLLKAAIDRLPVGEQVGDRSAAGEAAWHRKESPGLKPFGQLRGDGMMMSSWSVNKRVELHMPAGVGDRLNTHRLHSGLRHAVA